MKLVWIALITTLSLLNIQCADKKSSKTKKYFVQGDPKSMVAGTVMSTDLTSSNIKNFDGYFATGGTMFNQVSESQSYQDIHEEQKGAADGDTSRVSALPESSRFSLKEKDGKYIYSAKDGSFLTFVNTPSGVKVESISDHDYRPVFVDRNVQHISISKDQSVMSILIYYGPAGQKTLFNILFIKPTVNVESLERSSGDYDFYAGKNMKSRWKKGTKVDLNICSKDLIQYKDAFTRSLKLWTNHISSTTFEVKSLNNPPPFADLNTHCIYLAKNYFTVDPSQRGGSIGATIPLLTNEIVDSDIFFFESEINKFGVSLERRIDAQALYPTFIHEIGHFLGLGHPEDLRNPAKQTVMSYAEDAEVEYLFPHDIDSIIELYR